MPDTSSESAPFPVPVKRLSRIPTWAGGLAIAILAFSLLSIGLTRDWQLRHEDNGAMHTTLALSHQRLGLANTRAHDVFVDRFTGQATPYGHHPPGPALVLAAAFTLTGSDAPAVARLTVIAFHLGSILLLASVIALLMGWRLGIIGGLIMALLPMSTYFGRMVNYEPLCLFAVLLMLWGYTRHALGRRGGVAALTMGVIAGGLIDWPAFFFAAALAIVELVRVSRDRSASRRALIVLVTMTPGVLALDIWHLWYAGGGSIQSLAAVVKTNLESSEQGLTMTRFVLGQIDTFRRYFTHAGLVATLFVSFCLLVPRSRVARDVWQGLNPLVRYVLVATGASAVAYVLAAPQWSRAHQYWQFYFLPAAVISMVLAWRLLERRLGERPTSMLKALRLVIVIEVLVSSMYWLHFRHTRIEAHAVETTAGFRERLLTPRHLDAPGRPAR